MDGMKPQLDRRDAIFLALLLPAALTVYAWNLNAPFNHAWETAGTMFGLHARNFWRFGVLQLEVSGPTLEPYADWRREIAVSHPPLVDLVLALSFRLLGEREAAYRAPLVLFALLSLVALLALLRSLLDRAAAWIAAALYAFTPMVAYYSIVDPHLAPTMLFVFVELAAYRAWCATARRSWLAVLILAQVCACATDWAGYYAAAVIAVHSLWARRAWKLAVALPALTVACFLTYLLYVDAVGALDQLRSVAVQRTSWTSIEDQLRAEADELARHMTAALLAAAAAGLFLLARRWRDERSRFIFALGLLGFDQLLFRPQVVGHDYLTYPLTAMPAAAAGLAAVELWRRPALRPVALLLAAGFVAQAQIVIRHRLAPAPAFDIRYATAVAIREATRPGESVLLISRTPPYHVAYYADLHVGLYDPSMGTLEYSHVGPREKIPRRRLEEEVRAGLRPFDWIVTAHRDELPRVLPWLGAMADPDRDAILDFWCAERAEGRVHRGFVFTRGTN
jgi:4-amino-4-deoxy-L-arabinose transferase-like glycosyltransferase